MDDNKVPYIVYEGEAARHERTLKRLATALIVAIALLFASNMAWLWFFNQFDFYGDAVAQDTAGGDNSYIGEDGTIINGRTEGAPHSDGSQGW